VSVIYPINQLVINSLWTIFFVSFTGFLSCFDFVDNFFVSLRVMQIGVLAGQDTKTYCQHK